jgi:hypothetical protein
MTGELRRALSGAGLREALCAKYATAAAAMRALGLDPDLLKQERKLAMNRIAYDRSSVSARGQDLPAHIGRQLDELSNPAAKQVFDHLSKRFGRDADSDEMDLRGQEAEGEDQDPNSMLPSSLSAGSTGMPPPGTLDEEEENDGGKALDRLCGVLEELGIDPAKIEKVREMFANGGGDGDLLLKHEAAEAGAEGGRASAFDNGEYGAGSAPGAMPPAFRGRPTPGGQVLPITNPLGGGGSQVGDGRGEAGEVCG